MNIDEILKEFDTPTQQQINQLRIQIQICQNTIFKNGLLMSKLADKLDKEHNIIANRLDRMDSGWRDTIIKDTLARTAQLKTNILKSKK